MPYPFTSISPAPSSLQAVYTSPSGREHCLPVACFAMADDGEIVAIVADRWGNVEDVLTDQFWCAWLLDGERHLDLNLARVADLSIHRNDLVTTLPVAEGTRAIFEVKDGLRLVPIAVMELGDDGNVHYLIADDRGELVDPVKLDGFVGFVFPDETMESDEVVDFLRWHHQLQIDEVWAKEWARDLRSMEGQRWWEN